VGVSEENLTWINSEKQDGGWRLGYRYKKTATIVKENGGGCLPSLEFVLEVVPDDNFECYHSAKHGCQTQDKKKIWRRNRIGYVSAPPSSSFFREA